MVYCRLKQCATVLFPASYTILAYDVGLTISTLTADERDHLKASIITSFYRTTGTVPLTVTFHPGADDDASGSGQSEDGTGSDQAVFTVQSTAVTDVSIPPPLVDVQVLRNGGITVKNISVATSFTATSVSLVPRLQDDDDDAASGDMPDVPCVPRSLCDLNETDPGCIRRTDLGNLCVPIESNGGCLAGNHVLCDDTCYSRTLCKHRLALDGTLDRCIELDTGVCMPMPADLQHCQNGTQPLCAVVLPTTEDPLQCIEVSECTLNLADDSTDPQCIDSEFGLCTPLAPQEGNCSALGLRPLCRKPSTTAPTMSPHPSSPCRPYSQCNQIITMGGLPTCITSDGICTPYPTGQSSCGSRLFELCRQLPEPPLKTTPAPSAIPVSISPADQPTGSPTQACYDQSLCRTDFTGSVQAGCIQVDNGFCIPFEQGTKECEAGTNPLCPNPCTQRSVADDCDEDITPSGVDIMCIKQLVIAGPSGYSTLVCAGYLSPYLSCPDGFDELCPITDSPSTSPTMMPSGPPTTVPTSSVPSTAPSQTPTMEPSHTPTSSAPSSAPTVTPTSSAPSSTPTVTPSSRPTPGPTALPTRLPTARPTTHPSSAPTEPPSVAPTVSAPSSMPTQSPTAHPTANPSTTPSAAPTHSPLHDGAIHSIDILFTGNIGELETGGVVDEFIYTLREELCQGYLTPLVRQCGIKTVQIEISGASPLAVRVRIGQNGVTFPEIVAVIESIKSTPIVVSPSNGITYRSHVVELRTPGTLSPTITAPTDSPSMTPTAPTYSPSLSPTKGLAVAVVSCGICQAEPNYEQRVALYFRTQGLPVYSYDAGDTSGQVKLRFAPRPNLEAQLNAVANTIDSTPFQLYGTACGTRECTHMQLMPSDPFTGAPSIAPSTLPPTGMPTVPCDRLTAEVDSCPALRNYCCTSDVVAKLCLVTCCGACHSLAPPATTTKIYESGIFIEGPHAVLKGQFKHGEFSVRVTYFTGSVDSEFSLIPYITNEAGITVHGVLSGGRTNSSNRLHYLPAVPTEAEAETVTVRIFILSQVRNGQYYLRFALKPTLGMWQDRLRGPNHRNGAHGFEVVEQTVAYNSPGQLPDVEIPMFPKVTTSFIVPIQYHADTDVLFSASLFCDNQQCGEAESRISRFVLSNRDRSYRAPTTTGTVNKTLQVRVGSGIFNSGSARFRLQINMGRYTLNGGRTTWVETLDRTGDNLIVRLVHLPQAGVGMIGTKNISRDERATDSAASNDNGALGIGVLAGVAVAAVLAALVVFVRHQTTTNKQRARPDDSETAVTVDPNKYCEMSL